MTLMLVDDDVEEVELMEHLLDWGELGYDTVITAAGGPEAMEAGGAGIVDLLITDIDMPGVDGYELTGFLRGRNPDLIVIFLTCHEDFNYARAAITAGADEYLLKYALTAASLRKTIAELKEKKAASRRDYHVLLGQGRDGFKTRFLEEVMDGNAEGLAALRPQMDLYHFRAPDGPFCLISFYVDYNARRFHGVSEPNWEIWRELKPDFSEKDLPEGFSGDELFRYRYHLILLHAWPAGRTELDGEEEESLRRMKEKLEGLVPVRLSVCRSDTYTDLLSFQDAVADLERRRDGSFYCQGAVRTRAEDEVFAPMSRVAFNEWDRKARELLRRDPVPAGAGAPDADLQAPGDRELAAFWERFLAKRYDPAMARRLFRSLDAYLVREIVRCGGESYEDDFSGMCFDFCRDALMRQYENYKRQLAEPGRLSSNEDIDRVLRYIDENLDQKITLQSAAGHIYKNSSYLSRLFKQHTGMSFTDYLIRRRLDTATELLENTNLSVEEISEKIGIDNVSYFYQFYKRETGKTPRDIRRRGGGS